MFVAPFGTAGPDSTTAPGNKANESIGIGDDVVGVDVTVVEEVEETTGPLVTITGRELWESLPKSAKAITPPRPRSTSAVGTRTIALLNLPTGVRFA